MHAACRSALFIVGKSEGGGERRGIEGEREREREAGE
jgi:hypothetical protein